MHFLLNFMRFLLNFMTFVESKCVFMEIYAVSFELYAVLLNSMHLYCILCIFYANSMLFYDFYDIL